MTHDIYPLTQHYYQLAESPIWDPSRQCLYWVDIPAGTLQCVTFPKGGYRQWNLGEPVATVALHQDGNLILPSFDTIYYFNVATGKKTAFAHQPVKARRDFERFNDSACDVNGNFWVGSATWDFSRPHGRLYRVDKDGTCLDVAGDYYIANGMAFSTGNHIMYHADSWGEANCIYRYDFDRHTSEIRDREIFIQFDGEKDGHVDGITVDAEDHIWAAFWEGRCIRRLSPEGKVVLTIPMPVDRVTACVFGGQALDTLFATTCSQDVEENDPLPAPAGTIYEMSGYDGKGLNPFCYQGWAPEL